MQNSGRLCQHGLLHTQRNNLPGHLALVHLGMQSTVRLRVVLMRLPRPVVLGKGTFASYHESNLLKAQLLALLLAYE